MNPNRAVYVRALIVVIGIVRLSHADVLLNDTFADGSRLESKRPAEAAVWVGREADVTVTEGALSTTMGDSSQKIRTYFTESEPLTLAVGQKLTASLSFIPRKVLAETTSRSFRSASSTTLPARGSKRTSTTMVACAGALWTDATGYAVQVLVTGGEWASTKPFDLGKRTNLASPSLLGTSGDYTKMSGGDPVVLELDKEYRVTLEITKISDTQVDLTASLDQGDEQLSTFSLSDDGSWLGSEPICDKFDQLFIRIGDNTTTADQFDFTNFKVELTEAPSPDK